MTLTYTAADITALRPCPDWTQVRVERTMRGRALTLAQMLRLRSVPAADRVWLGCRLMSPAQRTRWLTVVVQRAVETHALHCGVPEVETWAQLWLSGADRSAGSAWDASAASTAFAAFAAFAACAAWAAAVSASASAASTAWAAVSAARAAVSAFSGAAAERKRQVRDMVDILEEAAA